MTKTYFMVAPYDSNGKIEEDIMVDRAIYTKKEITEDIATDPLASDIPLIYELKLVKKHVIRNNKLVPKTRWNTNR